MGKSLEQAIKDGKELKRIHAENDRFREEAWVKEELPNLIEIAIVGVDPAMKEVEVTKYITTVKRLHPNLPIRAVTKYIGNSRVDFMTRYFVDIDKL